jgi:RNA methyltransferase, TrmH family
VYDAPTISSLQNPTIRELVRLRDNRHRQRARVVLVDGVRETERAINAGLKLKSMFVAETGTSELVSLAKRAPIPVTKVSENVLQKIAFGQHHRDVVAVFDEPDCGLSNLRLSDQPLVIILDAVEKPGNVGAVLRTADAVGADAVILCEAACDLFNPSVIRSSLATVFSVPVAQADRASTVAWVAAKGLTAIAARVDAKDEFWNVDLKVPVAIIIGSEADGLGENWFSGDASALRSVGVRIPMSGAADSLNASVSAALLMFEAKRQRAKA